MCKDIHKSIRFSTIIKTLTLTILLPLLSSCQDRHSPDVYLYDGANEVQHAEKGTIIQVRNVKIASGYEKEQNINATTKSLGGAAMGAAGGAAIGNIMTNSTKATAIGAGVGALAATAITAGIATAMMDRTKDAFEYTIELDNGEIKVLAQTGKTPMKVGDRCLVITSKKRDELGNKKSRVVPLVATREMG